jgi:signal peptidase I
MIPMNILKNKYLRFSIAALIYILFVIWDKNYWLFLGLPIIFDVYISKKVNWTFWKKRGVKNSTFIEWLDALIFAVVAVTLINVFLFQNYKIPTGSMEKSLLIGDHLYVSKVAFGPKIPNTPLSFPFTQHTMPLSQSAKSFVTWIQWPYKRLSGLSSVKNDDAVVFNFPEGDTVVIENQAKSYYAIIREIAQQMEYLDHQNNTQVKSSSDYLLQARSYVREKNEIVVRPVDKRDNYIKRCVAIPGDTLRVISGKVFINSKPQKNIAGIQYRYQIMTNGTGLNPKAFERMGIAVDDVMRMGENGYELPLTQENADKIKGFPNVVSIKKQERPAGEYADYIFPHDKRYPWNEDNFGPLCMPKKGVTIRLTLDNLSIYERIIDVYEGNTLKVKGNTIYVNGKVATSYTFKMNYYFMMGDNRHDSADSRFWGFVPEDHIVGKPEFIWLSLNKDKGFPANIRWNRMFMVVK